MCGLTWKWVPPPTLPVQAHTAAAEEAAVIAALSSELAAAAQRADVAEAAAEEAHLSIAELERQSDVQVRPWAAGPGCASASQRCAAGVRSKMHHRCPILGAPYNVKSSRSP